MNNQKPPSLVMAATIVMALFVLISLVMGMMLYNFMLIDIKNTQMRQHIKILIEEKYNGA